MTLDKPNLDVSFPAAVSSGGGWPLKVDNVHSDAWFPEAFSVQECESIIALAESYGFMSGKISGVEGDESTEDNLSVRDSGVYFLFPSFETVWIFERLAHVVHTVNDAFFNFDLTGINEGCQIAKYEAPSGHYDWHCDTKLGERVRKLSISLQLSDPASYEGGDIELSNGAATVLPRGQGTVCCFPSWSIHRVNPVTSGVRYSLVAWVTGPQFR